MKQAEKEDATKKLSETDKQKKQYFTLRIPRLNFKNGNINAFLVAALIIFAFVLGMLTNKVIYLQEQNKKLQQAQVAPTDTGAVAVPTPPEVVKDMKPGKLPVLGNKEAKVTVVEFSDFQCPFCEKFFTDTEQQLYDKYIKTNKIAFAYRHYPLVSIHPNAQKAGEASECANDQGRFWDYHNILFQNQSEWSPLAADDLIAKLTTYAENAGIDASQFQTCLQNDTHKKAVEDDLAYGDTVQVDGTPTFFINGKRVVGAVPFSELEKVIEEELKK